MRHDGCPLAGKGGIGFACKRLGAYELARLPPNRAWASAAPEGRLTPVTDRVEVVRKIVEDALAARGERKHRLAARAHRAICGILHTAEEVTRLPPHVRAWLPREPGQPDATWAEQLVLNALQRSMWSYAMPYRPIVSSVAGNKHAAQRLAKRMQKRSMRRTERRIGKDVVLEGNTVLVESRLDRARRDNLGACETRGGSSQSFVSSASFPSARARRSGAS